MTAIRYMDRLVDQSRKTIATMGSLPGPGGGDGWSIASILPAARLASTSHGYVFMCTGRIVNVRRYGSVPSGATGKLQVALASSAGTKSTTHLFETNVADLQADDNGLPFAFMVTCGGGISDPTWGSSWSGTADLQLIGRTYWNQDVPTYAVEFDLVDVMWAWVDVDAIPSGDVKVTQVVGADPAVYTPSGIASGNETWLTFWNVGWTSGLTASGGTQHVQAFQVGYRTSIASPASFVCKAGHDITVSTGVLQGRLGIASGAAGPAGAATRPQRTMGSFWIGITGGVGLPWFMTAQTTTLQSGSVAHTMSRFATVSIRLDNLQGVRWYEQPSPFGSTAFGTDYLTRYTGQFLPIEVPAGDLTAEPWSLATGIPLSTWGHSIWIDTSNGPHPWEPIGRDVALDPLGAVPSLSWGSHSIAAGAGAYRFLFRWVSEPGVTLNPPVLVQSIYAVTFNPVRDPDNANPSIPEVGPATALVPGTESVDAASLSLVPIQPDAPLKEAPVRNRERIDGGTGYVRTWSVLVGTRRSWALTWTGLTTTQRDSLLAFLRSNVAFAFVPTRDVRIAVGQVDRPSYQQVNGQIWSVAVTVAELIYTG